MDSLVKVKERLEKNPNDAQALYWFALYLCIKYESEEEIPPDAKRWMENCGGFEAYVGGQIMLKQLETISKVDPKHLEKDDLLKLELLDKSSDLGYKMAMKMRSSLSSFYFNSGKYNIAFRIISELAEQGHAEAQYNLGVLYGQGDVVQKDYRKAEEWLKKASHQGYDMATQLLKKLSR